MKKLLVAFLVCLTGVVVSGLLSPPAVVHAGPPSGVGMENCISISGDNNNDTVFTNNCGQDANVTVAGQKGTWAPGLLHTGGTMAHDNGNGPFRWFACNVPYIAYDSANQNKWPNYNTNQYICK
ncbi:MAG: hypothetical protein ACLP0H_20000 [Terriglobales bacterium]